MTDPKKPMNQRIEEALGPEPILTPEVLAKLKADGVITAQEFRLFTDGFNEPSNFVAVEDEGG
jgi:hypothetical protein